MNLRLRSDDPAAITRYTVLLLVAIILAGGVSYLITKAVTASDQSHYALSQTRQLRRQTVEIAAIAQQARGFGIELANARNQAILRDCRDQNHRHRATTRELDRLLAPYAKRARTPAQHRQLRANHRSTLLLIGALAPLQDCARLVSTDQATH